MGQEGLPLAVGIIVGSAVLGALICGGLIIAAILGMS
jgi:hypothetical protein